MAIDLGMVVNIADCILLVDLEPQAFLMEEAVDSPSVDINLEIEAGSSSFL